MRFEDYQARAELTNIHHADNQISFLLHGMVGEVGILAADYKKHLRDKSSYLVLQQRAEEEIGDLLWYTSVLASTLELSLSDIAQQNLTKVQDRWGTAAPNTREALDGPAPAEESFPRRFVVEFSSSGGVVEIENSDGEAIGDPIDDNTVMPDGYRYHDVFHLANAAVLGWSPTLRAMLKRKRKHDVTLDKVEDGARAIFTEEGIVAVIFRHAERHDFFEGVLHVESELLNFVRTGVAGLEVSVRTAADWESAILQGFEVFRSLKRHGGGRVICDLDAASVAHIPG